MGAAADNSPLGAAVLEPGATYGATTLTKIDFILPARALVLGTAPRPWSARRTSSVDLRMLAGGLSVEPLRAPWRRDRLAAALARAGVGGQILRRRAGSFRPASRAIRRRAADRPM